jgi:hypothetical protein
MTIPRSGRGLARIAAAALAVVAVGSFSPAPAAAAPASAMIRGGHFSPDTPGVDVYLTAFTGRTTKLWLSGVGYGDVSGYERLTPGLYAVSMRPHGAASSTPAALSWTLDARPGAAYTACAVGMNAKLHGIVLPDDLSAARSGTAKVRVIQAASRAGRANVIATGGPTLARNVAFATSTKYTTVPAGSYVVRASTAQAGASGSVQASARVALPAGTVHTVVVLDGRSGGITVRALDDAAGATVTPVGAVPAGGGGTAARPAAGSWRPLTGLALVLVLVGAGALRLRRTRPT